MARWMRGYTAAEMSTPKTVKDKDQQRLWQRRNSSDRWLWLSCLTITLLSTGLWYYANQHNASLLSKSRSENINADVNGISPQSPESIGKKTDLEVLPEHSDASDSHKTASTLEDHFEESADEHALRWWIDAAPRPQPSELQSCLKKAQGLELELMQGENGLSILTQGRNRPQVLYEQNEQLWIKTPQLNTAHQQAYDHLLLISCLKSPGATLYDPLLIRQWGGNTWPKHNRESGSLALDDLFVVRSKNTAHFTYGLFRLGLPELGLNSQHIQARDVLQEMTLFWIIHPQGRKLLQDLELKFEFKGSPLQLTKGERLSAWLGPKNVMVLQDQKQQDLSQQILKKLLKQKGSTTESSSRQSTPNKKRTIKRRRPKSSKGKSSRSKKSKSNRQPKPKSKKKPTLDLKYR